MILEIREIIEVSWEEIKFILRNFYGKVELMLGINFFYF